ncbi:hypothetical protein [Rhizobium sp. LCM 4573]|uniref:hypothetical protein n=1 Tax=Rhizobium sp. LCM 4573 TaxID=1848291 RepID=UPI0008DA94FA|nr:hypothetical protein [Rhizobium sp. LCM 4573]OHV81658.1 hypothetical protein LCM4573_21495 [Rhizobium sp. LCM 4573]
MSEALDHLIKKGSYFYRPNKQGYTSFKFDAGRYTKADAEAEASVEPWHMKAIHQDDVPEDTAPDKHIAKLRTAMETALRIIDQKIKAVEAKPESEFGSDFYGDPSVPGGTFAWSKKDEELHYLRRDAQALRAALGVSV